MEGHGFTRAAYFKLYARYCSVYLLYYCMQQFAWKKHLRTFHPVILFEVFYSANMTPMGFRAFYIYNTITQHYPFQRQGRGTHTDILHPETMNRIEPSKIITWYFRLITLFEQSIDVKSSTTGTLRETYSPVIGIVHYLLTNQSYCLTLSVMAGMCPSERSLLP